MAISLGSMMLVRVGGGWLLGVYLGLGVFGVWFARLIDWAFRTLCFLLRVRRKLWLEHPAPDKK